MKKSRIALFKACKWETVHVRKVKIKSRNGKERKKGKGAVKAPCLVCFFKKKISIFVILEI